MRLYPVPSSQELKSHLVKLAIVLLSTVCAEAAIVLNQIENFSGAHEWTSGLSNPNPPVTLADSGPMGDGDTALRVSANGGSGAGRALIVFNTTAWAGNYTAANVIALAASLRNMGTTKLSFRLGLNGDGGRFVTDVFEVLPFSGWTNYLFDLSPGALISTGGSNAAATLGNVTQLRILHSTGAAYEAAPISGSFLVDQIKAVPEPSIILCAAFGVLGLFTRKR